LAASGWEPASTTIPCMSWSHTKSPTFTDHPHIPTRKWPDFAIYENITQLFTGGAVGRQYIYFEARRAYNNAEPVMNPWDFYQITDFHLEPPGELRPTGERFPQTWHLLNKLPIPRLRIRSTVDCPRARAQQRPQSC
jgi:hypothetical protein